MSDKRDHYLHPGGSQSPLPAICRELTEAGGSGTGSVGAKPLRLAPYGRLTPMIWLPVAAIRATASANGSMTTRM
jgi:hypothetical protein